MATIRKRVGPQGTRYMAVVRREGQSCTATFRTKSEAKKWAGITEAAITKGKHLPNPEAKRRTVRDPWVPFSPELSRSSLPFHVRTCSDPPTF